MPPSTTNKPSPSWDRKSSTAKVSRASKNTSLSNFDRGKSCEEQALRYFIKQGYQLKFRNHSVAGVEVDLILFKDHWLLVEVKSLSGFEQLPYRLSWRQKQRLQRARENWLSWRNQPTALRVAFVAGSEVISLDIEDLAD